MIKAWSALGEYLVEKIVQVNGDGEEQTDMRNFGEIELIDLVTVWIG